jgi:hypothetical protein
MVVFSPSAPEFEVPDPQLATENKVAIAIADANILLNCCLTIDIPFISRGVM